MVKSKTSTTLVASAESVSNSGRSQKGGPDGDDSTAGEKVLKSGPSPGRRLWDKWLKVAEVIGTIQMVIILSIMYWLILPFIAIPFRLFSDPLKVRRREYSNWHEKKRDESISAMDSMGNQY